VNKTIVKESHKFELACLKKKKKKKEKNQTINTFSLILSRCGNVFVL